MTVWKARWRLFHQLLLPFYSPAAAAAMPRDIMESKMAAAQSAVDLEGEEESARFHSKSWASGAEKIVLLLSYNIIMG